MITLKKIIKKVKNAFVRPRVEERDNLVTKALLANKSDRSPYQEEIVKYFLSGYHRN